MDIQCQKYILHRFSHSMSTALKLEKTNLKLSEKASTDNKLSINYLKTINS